MNNLVDTFRLRIGDFDCHDRILSSSVLDFFQDVAGKHAMQIGIGFEDLMMNNKIWVVIRNRYTLLKEPKEHTNISVKTWPVKPNRIDTNRYYEIYNEEGELCIHGASQWIVLDATSRRILKLNDIFANIQEYEEKPEYDRPLEKQVDFDISGLAPHIVKTSYFDLDHNGHINNSKYANYIIEGVEELQDKIIKEFEIDYVKELQKDVELSIYYKKENNLYYVKGCSNGETNFIARLTIVDSL